jgi:hypothetical protein
MLASRLAMSYSISTLLFRNLRDVFGENDLARRRAALDELWNEDGGRIAPLYLFFDKLPSAGLCCPRYANDERLSATWTVRQLTKNPHSAH